MVAVRMADCHQVCTGDCFRCSNLIILKQAERQESLCRGHPWRRDFRFHNAMYAQQINIVDVSPPVMAITSLSDELNGGVAHAEEVQGSGACVCPLAFCAPAASRRLTRFLTPPANVVFRGQTSEFTQRSPGMPPRMPEQPSLRAFLDHIL